MGTFKAYFLKYFAIHVGCGKKFQPTINPTAHPNAKVNMIYPFLINDGCQLPGLSFRVCPD